MSNFNNRFGNSGFQTVVREFWDVPAEDNNSDDKPHHVSDNIRTNNGFGNSGFQTVVREFWDAPAEDNR